MQCVDNACEERGARREQRERNCEFLYFYIDQCKLRWAIDHVLGIGPGVYSGGVGGRPVCRVGG